MQEARDWVESWTADEAQTVFDATCADVDKLISLFLEADESNFASLLIRRASH